MKNRKITVAGLVLFLSALFPAVGYALENPLDDESTSTPLIIMANKGIEGVASWYAHARYPNGAATNLFPLGTKLKVTNTANNKSTVVTITSTWTQKDSRRVIDLVSMGFKKLSPLSKGLIKVKLEKL